MAERQNRARRHAVALRQCALFAADCGEHIAKAMTDAADFLDELAKAENGVENEVTPAEQ